MRFLGRKWRLLHSLTFQAIRWLGTSWKCLAYIKVKNPCLVVYRFVWLAYGRCCERCIYSKSSLPNPLCRIMDRRVPVLSSL